MIDVLFPTSLQACGWGSVEFLSLVFTSPFLTTYPFSSSVYRSHHTCHRNTPSIPIIHPNVVDTCSRLSKEGGRGWICARRQESQKAQAEHLSVIEWNRIVGRNVGRQNVVIFGIQIWPVSTQLFVSISCRLNHGRRDRDIKIKTFPGSPVASS